MFRSHRLATLLVVALLGSAACAAGTVSSGPSASPTPSSTSASSMAPTVPESASPTLPGDSGTLVVGGDRPVKVQIPPGLDPNVPAPLLMLLHGYNSSGDEEEAWLRLGAAAARNGMIYLHPDGTTNSNGSRFWNATDACCDVDGSGVDDSSYLAALIAEIGTHVAVDPQRVFVVGHSNGAFMSHRMACDHADIIAAIVSLAGAPPADAAACRPSEPVAVLQVQGSADDQVRVAGGTVAGLAPGDDRLKPYPPLEASLAEWARVDGCARTRTPSAATLDLERTLAGANGPNETVVSANGGCHPGGGVELWMIQGGGHDPEFTDDFGARVVDFLLSHSKPD